MAECEKQPQTWNGLWKHWETSLYISGWSAPPARVYECPFLSSNWQYPQLVEVLNTISIKLGSANIYLMQISSITIRMNKKSSFCLLSKLFPSFSGWHRKLHRPFSGWQATRASYSSFENRRACTESRRDDSVYDNRWKWQDAAKTRCHVVRCTHRYW